ncbi:MAG: hypothetical protein HY909_20400 [Deltaproteobacteria bacterium]|nr:hypothetical protein [Deltaproteobacteria bacterium]
MTSPRGKVAREAPSLEPRSSTAPLVTWAWERPEGWSHYHCRSRATPAVPARVTARFEPPASLEALLLRFEPGSAPKEITVRLSHPGAEESLPLPGTGDVRSLALPDAPLSGITLELKSGDGPVQDPSRLALAALAVRWRSPELALLTLREGAPEAPSLPFPADAPGGCLLPLQGATGLELRPSQPRPLGALCLRFQRLGAFGATSQVSSWARGLRAETPDGPARVAWALEASHQGLLAGETHLYLHLEDICGEALPWVRLRWGQLPPELSLLGATWDEALCEGRTFALAGEASAVPAELPEAVSDAPGEALREAGRFTPAAARALLHAPTMAVSLGLPGRAERVGVGPSGEVLLPGSLVGCGMNSAGACLRLAWRVAGHEGAFPLRVLTDDGALALLLPAAGLRATVAVVEREGAARVLVHFQALEARVVELAWTARDGLSALPGTLSVCAWPAGFEAAPLVGGHETRAALRVPAGDEGALVEVALTPGAEPSPAPSGLVREASAQWRAARSRVLGAGFRFTLPDAHLERVVRALIDHAAGFVDGDGRVPYGRFPGIYDGDVFGLEEDWLFLALAFWGHGERAWSAFRATYVNATHLSRAHYLHDLRNGLTPWQAARLARLHPPGAGTLTEPEGALLEACGQWVLEARQHTTPGALPGLLPPSRYGGDLDFPTQSLTANAANISGLYGLASLGLGDSARYLDEARDFRRAWLAALDAVTTTDSAGRTLIPMHTGGGDPGQYHPLMVAGILEPLHLLAADDPRLLALHHQLEASDALRLALPRFDGWGTGGRGIDAHYAVGYLLDQLLRGRREVFWTGLCGLLGSAMDPVAMAFREVSDALPPGAATWLPELLPRRLLGQAEPCVGGVGVALQLLRASLLCEEPDEHGLPSKRLRVLPAPLPSWWWGGDLHLTDAPSAAGPVTLRVDNRLALCGEVTVTVTAPGAEALTVYAPTPPRYVKTQGLDECALPPGTHTLQWRFTAEDPAPVLAPGAAPVPRASRGRVRCAIVPAAGLGTRLLPVTLGTPKELLPLGRYPSLVATLLEVVHAGLADVVLTVSPAKASLRRALDPDTWPGAAAEDPGAIALRALLERLRLRFVEQPTPDGALDAVARARALVTDSDYVVLYPDFVHLPRQCGMSQVLSAWDEVRCTTFGLYTWEPGVSGRFGPSVSVEPERGACLAPGVATRLVGLRAPGGPLAPGELRTAFAVVQDARYDEALARAAALGHAGDHALLPALQALAEGGHLAGTLLGGELLDLGVAPGYLDAARRFAAGEACFEGFP